MSKKVNVDTVKKKGVGRKQTDQKKTAYIG